MAAVAASPYHQQHYEEEHDEIEEGVYDEADGSNAEESGLQEPTEQSWREIMGALVACGPILDPRDELADIKAMKSAVLEKDSARAKEVESLWAQIDSLQRDLLAAQKAAQRPDNQPSAKAHMEEYSRLEHQVEQTRDQLSEERSAFADKEVELTRWRGEKEEVGKIEVGDEEQWADGKVIRLKLFTEAGFTLIPGKDHSTSKVLIRNDAKSDLHTVSLDKSRSKAYNANVIWGLASE